MSFGWFACIYGIGYVVSVFVATAIACVYLSRRFGAWWPGLVGAVCASGEGGGRWACYVLLGFVTGALLWPVVVPCRMIRLVRDCNKKYRELYL